MRRQLTKMLIPASRNNANQRNNNTLLSLQSEAHVHCLLFQLKFPKPSHFLCVGHTPTESELWFLMPQAETWRWLNCEKTHSAGSSYSMWNLCFQSIHRTHQCHCFICLKKLPFIQDIREWSFFTVFSLILSFHFFCLFFQTHAFKIT